MVRVWFMDDEATDQRLEHHRTPEEYCSLEDLFKRTGVEYYHVNCVVIHIITEIR